MTKVINCYQPQAGRQGRRLDLRAVNACLASLLAVLGVFYLVNVNDLGVRGFALKDLRSQEDYLATQNLSYQEQVNNLQSYYTLSERTKNLGMVSVDEIDYLPAANSAIALR